MEALLNYYGGKWQITRSMDTVEVINPESGKKLANSPLSVSDEVNHAAEYVSIN